MNGSHFQTININTDGGSRGNPGPAAIGVHASTGTDTIFQLSEAIGHATNNTAEYTAVIKSLEHLLVNKIKCDQINFILDSELVVRQLTGQYKIKDANLIKLNFQIRNKISALKTESLVERISFTHVRREQNKIADSLVNRALDALT
jgi:ribonuclease HI